MKLADLLAVLYDSTNLSVVSISGLNGSDTTNKPDIIKHHGDLIEQTVYHVQPVTHIDKFGYMSSKLFITLK